MKNCITKLYNTTKLCQDHSVLKVGYQTGYNLEWIFGLVIKLLSELFVSTKRYKTRTRFAPLYIC